MRAARNAVYPVAALVCLTLLSPGGARAADYYCPIGFYGYMNGHYMYYCHYCVGSSCQSAGVAVDAMYSCGGDSACCPGGDTCIDPIPAGAILYCEAMDSERKDRAEGNNKDKGDAERGDNDRGDKAAAKKLRIAAADHIPTEIGHVPQRNYVSTSEKFLLPGDHIVKEYDYCVQVNESNASIGTSYFRVIKLNWVGHSDRTICFAMELDPDYAPKPKNGMPPTIATRKPKNGGHYQHTVTVNGEDYDASSVRDLDPPTKP